MRWPFENDAILTCHSAYLDGIRNYSVQAQYFRSPLDYDVC